VTAERRNENLQNVPISITAITSSSLESSGVVSTTDLDQLVPGLKMTQINTSVTPYLRGIGYAGTAAGQEAAVSIYVDGVYIPTMPGGLFSLSNIERVEVLEGPQGTLFGRNSVGGIIQIVTRDPSQDTFAKASVGYGNYQTTTTSFYGTTGIAPNLAADIAFNYTNQAQGYGRDLLTDQESLWTRELDLRSKRKLDLDDTVATLAVDYSRLRTADGSSAWSIIPGTLASGGYTHVGTFWDTSLNYPFGIGNVNGLEDYGLSLRIQHDFAGVRFVSISAIRDEPSFYPIDADITPLSIVNIDYTYPNKMASQEFQLMSRENSRFDWVAGLYGYYDIAQSDPLLISGSAFGPVEYDYRYADLRTSSVAAYADGTFHLTDQTRLTLGARVTNDHQHASGEDILGGGVGATNQVDEAKISTTPTWRAVLDRQFTPDLMVYGSYNRGFKAGGYGASNLPQGSFDPEHLDAFELGEKADVLSGHVRINSSVFYYNYKDIQVLVNKMDLNYLINAGKARIYGAELTAEAAPTSQVLLHASASFTHARFTEFNDAPFFTPIPTGGFAPVVGNAAGKTMPNAPPWTLSVGGTYTMPSAVGNFTLGPELSVVGGPTYFEVDDRVSQSTYYVLNSVLTWTHPDGRFKVTAWSKNMTNQKYLLNAETQTEAVAGYASPPVTYGLTLSWQTR
jgi:iron complex outermembrane receptor protein